MGVGSLALHPSNVIANLTTNFITNPATYTKTQYLDCQLTLPKALQHGAKSNSQVDNRQVEKSPLRKSIKKTRARGGGGGWWGWVLQEDEISTKHDRKYIY